MRAIDAATVANALEPKLEAQLVLAHAMVYDGEHEAGLRLMQETGEESRRAGLPWIATRAFVNLSDLQLMLGRYDDAVRTADEGMPMIEQAAFERTIGAFLRGNKGEALLRSGRWQEAMAIAAPGADAPGVSAGTMLLLRAELNMLSGHRNEAQLELREARRHLRRSASSQFALPLAAVEAEFARSGGDLEGAHENRRAGPGSDGHRRGAAVQVAGVLSGRQNRDRARAGGRARLGHGARMAALRARAEAMDATTASDRGHQALLAAQYARMARQGEAEAWSDAVAACRAMHEPYPLAYALLRHAEALAGAHELAPASEAAREALELAQGMGAAPLAEEIEALIRRARLRVAEEPEVAAVAEENGVSPELARLGVGTRLVAAATAHRMGLVRQVGRPLRYPGGPI